MVLILYEDLATERLLGGWAEIPIENPICKSGDQRGGVHDLQDLRGHIHPLFFSSLIFELNYNNDLQMFTQDVLQ